MGIVKALLPIGLRVKHGAMDGKSIRRDDFLTLYYNVRAGSTGYLVAEDVMKALTEYNPLNTFNEKVGRYEAQIIPISLLFDDPHMNMRSHFACYRGGSVKAKGVEPFLSCVSAGAKAVRRLASGTALEIDCPGPDKCPGCVVKSGNQLLKYCKMYSIFDFMLRGITETHGGVVRYRTTGFVGSSGILGQMTYLYKMFGFLRGIPLQIELSKNTSTSAVTGQSYTFNSLILTVQTKDLFTDIIKIKEEEMERRVKSGMNMKAVEDAFRSVISDAVGADEEESEEFAIENTEESDDAVADELAKLKDSHAGPRVEKAKETEAKRDSLREALIGKGPGPTVNFASETTAEEQTAEASTESESPAAEHSEPENNPNADVEKPAVPPAQEKKIPPAARPMMRPPAANTAEPTKEQTVSKPPATKKYTKEELAKMIPKAASVPGPEDFDENEKPL